MARCMQHVCVVLHHRDMALPENKVAALKRLMIGTFANQLANSRALHVTVTRQVVAAHRMSQLHKAGTINAECRAAA